MSSRRRSFCKMPSRIPRLPVSKQRKKGPMPYERLEFLGDRVLGLVIAEWLYEKFPDASEGEMAKRHAALVNREALRAVAVEIGWVSI